MGQGYFYVFIAIITATNNNGKRTNKQRAESDKKERVLGIS